MHGPERLMRAAPVATGRGVDAVDALMSHERNACVLFSKPHECFYVKGDRGLPVRYKGLTRVMAKKFFPDFDYKKAQANAAATAGPVARASRWKPGGTGPPPRPTLTWDDVKSDRVDPTVGWQKAGIQRGKVTHEHLNDYITMNRDAFMTKYKDGVYKNSRDVIWALNEWGVHPVASEFAIYDEELHYATSIDMVGYVTVGSGRRRLVLIEIKTGYDGYFETGAGAMRMPSGAPLVSDAPVNQALLQVLMARLTLKHRYGIVNSECLVIHVHGGIVRKYRVTADLHAHEDAIYEHARALFNERKSVIDPFSALSSGTTTTTTATASSRGRKTTASKRGATASARGRGRGGARSVGAARGGSASAPARKKAASPRGGRKKKVYVPGGIPGASVKP